MVLYFLLHVHEVACKQAFGDVGRGHLTRTPRVSSQASDREISPCFINILMRMSHISALVSLDMM